jgi:hypothetical protein
MLDIGALWHIAIRPKAGYRSIVSISGMQDMTLIVAKKPSHL